MLTVYRTTIINSWLYCMVVYTYAIISIFCQLYLKLVVHVSWLSDICV